MKKIATGVCWLALLLAPMAQAQSWQDEGVEQAAMAQAMAAHASHTSRLAGELAATDRPRELALAALLRTQAAQGARQAPAGAAPSRAVPVDAQAQAWLQAAARRAGDDVLALQLVIAADASADGTLRRQAATRWQALEPDNIAPLLQAGVPAETLLVQGRAAGRSDSRHYAMLRWISGIYRAYPPTPQEQTVLTGGEAWDTEEAAALAAAVVSAAIVPVHGSLLASCRGTALRAAPERRGDCRHVASVLADRPGTALDRAVGIDLLVELATEPAEQAVARQRQRLVHWQMLQWGQAVQRQPRAGTTQFARLLRDPTVTDELQLLARVLQEAGIPSEPPPGWMPPRR